MKKKDLPKIIIIATVILFVIPLLINLSFKIGSIRLLAAEWTAGDLLSFYGAVLGALITLIGLVVTLDYQSKQARKDDDVKYRPILKIRQEKRDCKTLAGISDLIKEEELNISFPGFDDSRYNWYGYKKNIKLLLENKGRGEATNVSLDTAYVKNASWDEDSHLDFNTSFKGLFKFIIRGSEICEAPYDYKPDFQFMIATWDYLNFQQIEEATSEH